MKKGFVAIFVVILLLVMSFGVVAVFLLRQEQFFLKNVHSSLQAYYLAETGIEDVLLKINNNPSLSDFSYSFEIDGGMIEIDVSENIEGILVIIAKGTYLDSIRRVRVEVQINFETISFDYGAHAGVGGLVMENNSEIRGNVFSNGNAFGANHARITNNIIVAAETFHRFRIGGNAKVRNCSNSQIEGDLFYINNSTCNVSGNTEQIIEIEPEEFPISEETINNWKEVAENGQLIEGDFYNQNINFLGPAHIEGDLTLDNNSTLKIQGNILVSGDLKIENGAVLELDENIYNELSGLIIIEGKTIIRPGAIVRGSGHEDSYLMVLSLNDSLEEAVRIDNTTEGGIFYVPYGAVLLNQGIKIVEVTAYKIILKQNAIVEYETGLQNLFFSSGAGSGWRILSWEKIK